LNRISLRPIFSLKSQQKGPARLELTAAIVAGIARKCMGPFATYSPRRMGPSIFGRCRLRWLLAVSTGFGLSCATVPQVHATDRLWACLLFATNEKMSRDVPTWLKNYNERLEKLVGYTAVRSLGQNEVTLQTGKPAVISLPGNMRIQLSNWVREGHGRFLVTIRFFRRDHALIETQARISRGSPLFFRGPLWRNGRLVVAVVIGQRTGWDLWDPWGD
jgi:hypothetical protein